MPFLTSSASKVSPLFTFFLRKETPKGRACSAVKEGQGPTEAAGSCLVASFLPARSKAHLGLPR